ncbi:hypothetical protein AURDEDRAFT_40838, partial [Auricularia subglabra TFB-10046 SS5]
GTTCSRCGGAESAYKCFECLQAPPLCKSCIKDAHNHAPFHEIHEWTGSHLRKGALAMSLWRAGLFPATFKKPQTAISAEALSNFHVLTLSAKTNATAFCTYLRRKTDYWSRDAVKDRSREFFMSFRMYCFLNNLMRNGLEVPSPGHVLEPGSMAVFCPACPQPEMNLDPKWKERDRRLRQVS